VNTTLYTVIVVCNSCRSAWYCINCDGRRYWYRHVVQNVWTPCESGCFKLFSE